ncbi:MAG: DUF4349 domain-containing protein [Hungatella hathewayi]|nr:DUF4349 domain-containing protein [Hungatella hathewayi]
MKKQCFNRRYGAAAAILAGALFLTGCGASKSSSAYMAETTAASYDNKAEVYQETAAMEYDQVSPEDGGLTSSTGNLNVQPASRKLIRNANMDVETSDFDGLLETISSQITALGGYTQDSSVTGSSMTSNNEPRRRYASITARIPQEKLDSFITTVEQNGNITNRYESTSDVTLQYSDLESRKKSLIVEQDRIWALLEKAESLDAVITLEKRLSEIRYELESMESQLRLYDNQVEYSTVSLSIQEVTTYTPTSPETFGQRIRSGLSKNADAMTAFMTGFLIWLITTSPIWLPLALIVLVILFFTRRRRGRERIKKAVQSAPSDIIDRTADISDTEEDVYYTEDK